MTSLNKQALREKFEAWAEEAGALPWGYLKKQRNASGNYSVQIYTYMWHAWSACHESLMDELEAAESYAKDRDEENQDLMLTIGRLRVEREASEVELDNALCELLPGTQYMDLPDGVSVTPLEQVRRMVADYRERIEELESRTVIISRPKIGRLHGALLHLWPEYDVRAAVEHAGIKFKVED